MACRRGLVLGGIVLVLVVGGFGASASAPAHTANNTTIEFVAEYPGEGGQTNATLAADSDIAAVGEPQQGQATGWRVPVTLSENGTQAFSETLVETGFLEDGIQQCRDADAGNRYCLVVYFEGEVVQTAGLGPRLAQTISDGDFNGQFTVGARNETQAQRIFQALSEQSGSMETTATTTAAQTETVTDAERDTTAAAETDATTTQREVLTTQTVTETTPSGFGPGFTLGTAALALLSGAVLFKRRGA